MNTFKKIVSGGMLLAALLVVFVWVGSTFVTNSRIGTSRYHYEPAGFSFLYPHNFIVNTEHIDEKTVLVVLRDKKDKVVPLSETPPVISCLMTLNSEAVPINEWIENQEYASRAGIVMSQTVYPSADIPNITAIGFKTDGLYLSDHVLFNSNDYVVDCSVGYITPDDKLRADFVGVVSTILVAGE